MILPDGLPIDDPSRLTPATGTLPANPTGSSDRVGRVEAGDLPLASAYDLSGMSPVSVAVLAWADLPDLVLEAVNATGITALRYQFGRPYAIGPGRPATDMYLVEDVTPLRRFVDSTRFLLDGGEVSAFLHAVVVAHPSAAPPYPSAGEREWVDSKMVAAGIVPGTPSVRPPNGVLVWSVGIETAHHRVTLQSGFVARSTRTSRNLS